MKKYVILGKGTAGAYSAAHIAVSMKRRNIDAEIQWIYDPSIPTQAVGEGVNLIPVTFMSNFLKFRSYYLPEIDGTFKSGILKKRWNKNGDDHFHHFNPPNVAYHLNALKTQDYIFNKITKLKNVKFIEDNIKSTQIDADYIIDCSGRPSDYTDYTLVDSIPVNSVYVTQCFWDSPKFQYSLTNAMKYGWYFGIPLQKRCSIGYLYNNSFNTLEEIKQDVKSVFDEYDLKASDVTNAFSFKSYYRTKNYVDNVCYNGNASFFLEPLEATTIGQIIHNCHTALEVILGNATPDDANQRYKHQISGILNMIMIHYLAESVYKTSFWEHANNNAIDLIKKSFSSNQNFKERIEYLLSINFDRFFPMNSMEILQIPEQFKEYGTWSMTSWKSNLVGLGIEDKLKKLLNDID